MRTKNQKRFTRAAVLLDRYLRTEGFRWSRERSCAKSPSRAEVYGVWEGSFKSMREAQVICDGLSAKMTASVSQPHVTTGVKANVQRNFVSGRLRWGKGGKPSLPVVMVIDRMSNAVSVSFDLNDGSF